ncbi:MAG: hypothetical protein IJV58_00355 [Oscillospiraceae bacterium]|nr:hypothetical protein [Oscillospiraceae bacterium]
MNQYELMKYARKGIETEIKNKCEVIADSWASPDNITRLESLIAQYREIMDEYNKAHDAKLEAEWLAEHEEG